nr:glycosyltransferase family A protein [uncultured Sphingomonas sp.]
MQTEQVRLAICILARNEAKNIGKTLTQLSEQSLFADRAYAIEVHVVANGCTDNTAATAAEWCQTFVDRTAILKVHDIRQGGKSRAWNVAVHELLKGNEFIVFVDADIEFVDRGVLAGLLSKLRSSAALAVLSGYPVKDISRKERGGFLDRFSLAISSASRQPDVINGSLYAARLQDIEKIWLPNDTPGEDGFLNAMVTTEGFTKPIVQGRVVSASQPTHYFKAHTVSEFFAHERRMLVGTMVNRWIFEYLWAQKRTVQAGRDIALWNESSSDWVDRIVADKTRGKRWLIPQAILLSRFRGFYAGGVKSLAMFPIRVAAVVVSLFPAIAANRVLRRKGANKIW